MTYTPGEGVNADGSTFADPNAGSFQVRSGGRSIDAVKVTNELTGQEEWDYEVENYQEETEGFSVDDYADALAETTPNLQDALKWAVNGGLTPEQVQEHDRLMDSDDPGVLNDAIDKLMNAFYEQNGEPVAATDEVDEPEMEPITEEEVDNTISSLTTNEAGGTEVAFQFLKQAEQTENPMERDLLMSAASFHRGEQSASFLIQQAIERYGQDAIAPFVRKMMG